MNKSLIGKIIAEYGELFELGGNGQLVDFNIQAFAELYRHDSNIVYIPTESTFYLYDKNTGLWKNQSKPHMLNRISLFIHECSKKLQQPAITRERKISTSTGILNLLKGLADKQNFFDNPSLSAFIHCENGVLEFDYEARSWKLQPFSPDYRSRSRIEITFNPKRGSHEFIDKLLNNLIAADDRDLIQQYMGQCLIGENITQTLLLITGSAGSGKSTLVRIIETVIGQNNCFQIRPEHITSRFELGFSKNKNLLSGRESTTSFFTAKGMRVIKSLVGDDDIRIEYKMSNKNDMIRGKYNLIIVGNSLPTLNFEGDDDKDAWRRRFRWIKCRDFKPSKTKYDFAGTLLNEESSGILNWMLFGAKKLLLADDRKMLCNKLQTDRLDYLFGSSDQLGFFLKSNVEKNHATTITGEELLSAFTSFCKTMDWPFWNQRLFQREIKDAMLEVFQVSHRRDVKRESYSGKMTNRSGFYHVRFKA